MAYSALPKNLMIVEDAPDIRLVMKTFLSARGYNVLEAQNGLEALKVLRSANELPRVIFLDLMMPIMDGNTFKQEKEKDPRLAGIPVVVMTADSHAQRKSEDIGAQGFLKKPMDLKDLMDAVAKYCS